MLRLAWRASRGVSRVWSFTNSRLGANGRYMSTVAAETQSEDSEDGNKFASEREREEVVQPRTGKGSNTSILLQNSIMRAADDGKHYDVFKYCAEMKQAGITPTRSVINAAIHSCAATRQIDTAFVLFDQMLQLKMKPDNSTLQGLLKACEVYSDLDRAIEITQKMREFEVYPEFLEIFSMISTFARAGEFDLAFNQYEAFKALFNVVPTECLRIFFQILTRTNDPEALTRLLPEIVKAKVSVSMGQIHNALELFIRERSLPGCVQILDHYGSVLPEGTLIQIIATAGRGKDHQIALQAFRVLCENTSNNPSKYAYNALMYSAIISGNIIAFLDAVNVMSLSGHKLSDVFSNLFTRICRTPQEMDTAHAHISVLHQSGQVAIDVFNTVMIACAHAGDMKRAIAVFTDCVQNYQLAPDIGSFNAILSACVKIQDLNSALGVMQQMTDAGVQPTLSTYQSIIELCVAVSDLERATATLSEMPQMQVQPTYQIYSNLVTLCLNVRQVEQAKAILDAMEAVNLKPGILNNSQAWK